MINMFKFFKNNEIGEPPWDYYFLLNLDEKEYPRYLAKLFKMNTGENLPLKYDFKQQAWVIDKKRCKTFNQKLQWIKLYGVTDLMRKCTDKVAVRDFVRERIGEEYLKPVLQIIPNDKSKPHPNPLPLGEGTNSEIQGFNQKMKADKLGGHPLPAGEGWGEGTALASKDVSTYFDQINWDKLPNAFVIKCNHGSKWQYIIKDKEQFLNTPQLFDIVKRQMIGWLEQEFFPWNGFEIQYRGIEPKILIESLMMDKIDRDCEKIQVYCFNKFPKFIVRIETDTNNLITLYDDNLNIIDDILSMGDIKTNRPVDCYIKTSFKLSMKLCVDFSFVRIDFFIFKHKLYFEELTFIPYSGFHKFKYGKNIFNINDFLIQGEKNDF